MGTLRGFYDFMLASSRAYARWELEISNNILKSRTRLVILAFLILPIIIVGIASVAYADALPEILGGKKAYAPAADSISIFIASIFVGLVAGLITGCIGAGGGFIIAPAMMSVGVKGILAVGTDLFHIFAKAIMGSVLHRKLGNVCVPLAIVFLVGAIGGATLGGLVNRFLYNKNPILSDAFITTVYVFMLGFLGFYALMDYLKAKKGIKSGEKELKDDAVSSLGQKLQSIKIPPMISFDQKYGTRSLSWFFLIVSGFIVGLAAAIMGVGGGFLTFPIFVYVLGVSPATTVGTDIFQIIFTASYASILQYAIYGFVFYTLAMGMLIGSLFGVQIGAMVTKVVPGVTICAFYALAVLTGFVNRIFALPEKLRALEVIGWSEEFCGLLANIGTYVFFIALLIFTLWIFKTFFISLGKLREVE